MAANSTSNQHPLSPTASTASMNQRPRRDSSMSRSSSTPSSQIDREQLAQKLDKIHTSASRTESLTTFNDFGSPPGSLPVTESKGIAGDFVQQGFSGLYSRFREAVGGGSGRQDAEDADTPDSASRHSSNTVNSVSRTSVAPLARGETTTGPAAASKDPSEVPSPGMVSTTGGQSLAQSTKGTSLSSMAASKSSSRQGLSNAPQAPSTIPHDTVTGSGLYERDDGRRPPGAEAKRGRGSSTRRSFGKPSLNAPSAGMEGSSLYNAQGSGDATMPTIRGRNDDGVGGDGTADTPMSPVKSVAASSMHSLSSARTPAAIGRARARSPSFVPSRSSSMDLGTAEGSSINTSAHNSAYREPFTHDSRPQHARTGALRIPSSAANDGAPGQVNATLEIMKKQVLSKEFWMADETCKECFQCGDAFNMVRRKHHCRTCGCIFDSKCTSIISGQKFGVSGNIRVCKGCLSVINRRYDTSGSDDSADDSYLPAIFRSNQSKGSSSAAALRDKLKDDADDLSPTEQAEDQRPDTRSAQTPMMAIPATRRIGDSNRQSAVLEIDAPPQLSRPSSSRSLKSLVSSRPQSSGHKRHHSKHNLLGKFKATPDDRAPFRRELNEDLGRKSKLPAFHDDNIIDPELAAYMSDESSGDEHMSIFATMSSDNLTSASYENDKTGFGPFLTAGKKHRMRGADKSISGMSFTSRGLDDSVGPGSHLGHRPSRRRNLSNVSSGIHHLRSPRPKSGAFKGPSVSNEMVFMMENPGIDTTRLTRSDSLRDEREQQIQLNSSSKQHVKKLLKQLLQDADIPNVAAWERALIPILIQCTDDVTPDVRGGDDMDIRHYVKFKKIPGGRPGDTSYVSGVIFTKNLALKSMPRRIIRPRIVIVSFPIEYQRHQQHFMSLQPVIEQEKEFLRIVVNRIAKLQPHVLLSEKSVSGRALEMLSAANIAVAYNVKTSVIEAVSRCAEADIISSLDMLAIPVRVGFCDGFEVKTYVNNDYPGRKKSYIFLSGCNPALGCTIALRGATTSVLAKVKKITEFMVYVVYNLKLETCLMRDEFIHLPSDVEETSSSSASMPSASRRTTDDSLRFMAASGPPDRMGPTVVINTTESEPPTQTSVDTSQGSLSLEAPSADNNQTDDQNSGPRLVSMHQSHARRSTDGHDSPVPEDVPMPTFYSDMVARYETKILSASPFVKFTQPYLLMRAREQERRLVYLKRLRDQDVVEDQGDAEKATSQRFQLIKPDMVHAIGHKAPRQIMEVLHAVHDAEYDKALHNYQTHTRQWENYIQGNLDLFDPYSHQNIVVLYSVICTESKIPCIEPSLITIGFYDEQHVDTGFDADCTLGQYIEDLCYSKDQVCTGNGCERIMLEHHRTYVHDESRITLVVEKAAKPSPTEDVTMWSYCKVCQKDSPVIPMSESTWKYSFGKYLELLFWSRGLRLNDQADCSHDHHRDHIRYFALRDTWVRIHYDPIDLLEIIVPRPRITWKVEHDLNLKNDIFTKTEERWNRFMASVKSRLKTIRIDVVLPEKAEACKAEVDRLMKKVQEDHAAFIRKLQQTYVNSKYYEVIPFNVLVREMLQLAGEWDSAFAQFESDFLPDKDVRQLTVLQLKKMFTDNESRESLPAAESIASTAESDDRPSQTFTEADERSTQPTDYTNSSLADSAASSRPGDAETTTEGAKVIVPAEGAIERVEPLDLATSGSPSIMQSPRSPAPALATSPTPSAEMMSKVPSPDGLATPRSPTWPQDRAQPPTEDPVAAPSLGEKLEELNKDRSPTPSPDAPTLPSTPEPAKASSPEKGGFRRAGSTISPPIIRALSQPVRQLPKPQPTKGKESKVGEATGAEPPSGGTMKVDKKLSDRLVGALKNRKGGPSKPGPSSIPRLVAKKQKESKVVTLARHFEQLSKEFENQRIRERKKRAESQRERQPRAKLPRTTTQAIVEVYDDVEEAVQEPGPSEDDQRVEVEAEKRRAEDGLPGSTKDADGGEPTPSTTAATSALPTPGEEKAEPQFQTPSEAEASDNATVQASPDRDMSDEEGVTDTERCLEELLPDVKEIAEALEPTTEELPRHQKTSLLKMLTNFWAERSSSGWQPLEYPVSVTDHIFMDSDIIVREDEPSSLIAFALSSEDYRAKLGNIRYQWQLQIQKEYEEGDMEPKSLPASETMGQYVDEELEKSLLQVTGTHIKYQFTEGSAKMMCKVFFAEQFDALRRKTGVADRIIESMSRCLKWDSRGGKTRAVFLKTLDDRFVLKSLSAVETAAFLHFAPSYFSIMAEALFHDLPSVIAKMVGFFQIFVKNPATGADIKLDLLVMENLFYDRSPGKIFDLKGSMRNRKIQSTGEQNEVLLDENMVEYIYESPLFAREHSKKLLRASVWNDTLFLARQNVMDYSLMIAIDSARKELVVGIVDCIRTYTLDKKLESWIKDRGFAGGGRNRPTITSPKEYKSRFREAMARYILQAPNCWHQFGLHGPGTRPRFELDGKIE